MDSSAKDSIEKSIRWANAPPPPMPGMCYIEPEIRRDFSSFDDSLEALFPKQLHTDLLDALDIDFMRIVMEHDEPTQPRAASEDKRGDILEREKIKRDMKELFDFQKYIQDSFEDVDDIVHPADSSIGVKAAFDVFPADIENVLIQSDCADLLPGALFELAEGPSQLFSKIAMPDGSMLSCLPQRISDFVSLHISDGKAYYSDISTLYRIQEHRSAPDK